MRKYVIICNVVLIFFLLANIIFFYLIPATLPYSSEYYHPQGRYDYPSVSINKPANGGGDYYYPLISIDKDDDCEYKLVKDSIFGYTIDSTSFLKRHKKDLIVYNPDVYYGSTYDSCYELYKDGQLIDMVPCIYFYSTTHTLTDRTFSFDFIMRLGATNKIYLIIDLTLLSAYAVLMYKYFREVQQKKIKE